MVEEIKEFVLNFFGKLECDIVNKGEFYIIDKVPKAFLDISSLSSPIKISFSKQIEDCEFIDKNSNLLRFIERFLDNVGKTTLLKIDFEVDPILEIKKHINLKNCKINNIIKKNKNNFFSRFSFLTTFRFLNEKEQMINEIYVHDGKVVQGDLSGYKVVEGDIDKINHDNLKEDYNLAKDYLVDLLKSKKEELSNYLLKELDKEIDRIKEYYNTQLGEYGGELNKYIDKIKELELKIRTSEGEKKNELLGKISRLKEGLVKLSNGDSKEKVLKEMNFSIKDAQQKFSLNLNNKLLNTTIIYYPVFVFDLSLDNDDIKKTIEVSFDPLTKEFSGLSCENCHNKLKEVILCSNGHLTCDNCLKKCGGCNKTFCGKCNLRKCEICGKSLCIDCVVKCKKCGSYVCKDHLRMDSLSGEEFCINCLRACSRCHNLTQEKFFGVSKDNSKICQRCLVEEKRKSILRNVFD